MSNWAGKHTKRILRFDITVGEPTLAISFTDRSILYVRLHGDGPATWTDGRSKSFAVKFKDDLDNVAASVVSMAFFFRDGSKLAFDLGNVPRQEKGD